MFGRPWNEERYWASVRDASLEKDLELLPDGDLTEVSTLLTICSNSFNFFGQIGEKGISKLLKQCCLYEANMRKDLSGGQKQ